MVVLDGIVMGPTHCAYDNCHNDLSNSQGGSLCDQHHLLLVLNRTSVCQDHQTDWNIFRKYSCHNVHDPLLPPNYFSPAHYYCVETICAPCGIVIAWTKFACSESTTNILNFLASVLATAVTNGSWGDIEAHIPLQDYLCQTYCNPAPANNVAQTCLLPNGMTPGNFNWFIPCYAVLSTLNTQLENRRRNQLRKTEDDDIGIDEKTETEEEAEESDVD
ncbi:hypothetical protein CPB84DRAFT_1817930 [Gymnopilus junonius]|uniref:CxC6 like cysteine cluster associated with KDZ domain-containing protein n=1 Tax=Gymnopilus junonius TaxID=109634 RepID=A0A9P5NBQ7_GYMJU|nr:hypothetical protein CPB84DRAFT_1817930 [Gymnopilus junonius]